MSRPYIIHRHTIQRRKFDMPAVLIHRREAYSAASSEAGSEFGDAYYDIVNDPRIIELPRGYSLRLPSSGSARRDIVISLDEYYRDNYDPIVVVEHEKPRTRRRKSYSYRRRASAEQSLSLDDVRSLVFDKSGEDHQDFDEELRALRKRRLERAEEELLEEGLDREGVFGWDHKLAKRRRKLQNQYGNLEGESSWGRARGTRSIGEIQMDLDRCNRELRECRAQILRLQNPTSRSYP